MAVTATSIAEIRTTGNDLNGGWFDSAFIGSGTDYSQQTGAQVTFNGTTVTATTVGASATITITGYTVQSTDVGNGINIASGTNFTAGQYIITSVDTGANTWTMNSNVTTGNGAAMVGRMGGAFSTLTRPTLIAGAKVYVKATATYSITAANNILNTSGTSLAWIMYEGYNATRGDNGQVTVQRSSGSSFNMIGGSGNFRTMKNFIIDGNSGTSIGGVNYSGLWSIFENCKVMNCTTFGFTPGGTKAKLINCVVTGTSGTAAFNITGTSIYLLGCRATGNSIHGFLFNGASALLCVAERCIADANTGSSTGFKIVNINTVLIRQCVAYNNGSDGILFDTTASSACIDGAMVNSCILVSNGGYGLNANAATVPFFDAVYNAFYNNTSGARNNISAGTGDVTLTGVPFTNAGSNDFSLNNTSGQGAACRAVGWPGVLQSGGIGYLDLGALQHADSGSSGMLFIPNLEGT